MLCGREGWMIRPLRSVTARPLLGGIVDAARMYR